MSSPLQKRAFRSTAVVLPVVTFAWAACSGGDSGVSEADVARAKEALAPFKKELKAALLAGLESGPGAAVEVCKLEAPEIASSHSVDGVRMGRTSHKLRNPENAPAPWMQPLLDYYVRGGDEPYRAVGIDLPGSGETGTDATTALGYVEPIYVGKPCLMCHGKAVAPALAERITLEYPGDKATGFEEGEFRGLFWVTIPPEAGAQ